MDEWIEDTDPEENGFVGHVTASEGLRIGIEESEVYAYIRTDHRDNETKIGDYVEISVGDDILFGEVIGLEYMSQSPVDDMDDIPGTDIDIEESDFPLRVQIDPITILREEDEELKRRSVDSIPKPRTKVYLVEDQNTLYRGLNIPEEGIPLGHVAVSGDRVPRSGDPLVYNLRDPPVGSGKEPAIFRHLLIAGTTGKGKTHSTKNLITQIVGRGTDSRYETDSEPKQICGLILDPDNEYSQLAQPPENDVTEWERQGFVSGPLDDVHAFVPVADGVRGPQPPADQVTRVSIPFEIVEDRPEVMSLDAPPATSNLIRRLLDTFFERHTSPEYRDLLQWIETQDQDDWNANGNMWSAMERRFHKSHFQAIFDQGSQSILDMAEEIFKPGRVSVIPTDHLRGERERFLVMFLISWVVENKISNDDPVEAIRDTPLLFSVDEAHNYLSGSESSQGDYIVDNFVEAAKQGRKRQLSLQLTTQNPGDIVDPVIKQINTRIYMGLEDEVVQDISVPRGFGQRIVLFDQGQMAVKAPDTQPTEVMSLPDCLVRH